MKLISLFLVLSSFTFLSCDDSSSSKKTEEKDNTPGSETIPNQVVQGNIEAKAFSFVSGYYKVREDGITINLYAAEPLPAGEAMWTPYASNLDIIIIPMIATPGVYKIPYKLHADQSAITYPTLYSDREQKNYMGESGVVEILTVDDANGIITGRLKIDDSSSDSHLAGHFTVTREDKL